MAPLLTNAFTVAVPRACIVVLLSIALPKIVPAVLNSPAPDSDATCVVPPYHLKEKLELLEGTPDHIVAESIPIA